MNLFTILRNLTAKKPKVVVKTVTLGKVHEDGKVDVTVTTTKK